MDLSPFFGVLSLPPSSIVTKDVYGISRDFLVDRTKSFSIDVVHDRIVFGRHEVSHEVSHDHDNARNKLPWLLSTRSKLFDVENTTSPRSVWSRHFTIDVDTKDSILNLGASVHCPREKSSKGMIAFLLFAYNVNLKRKIIPVRPLSIERKVKIDYFAVCLTKRPERLAHVKSMCREVPSLEIVDAIDGRRMIDGPYVKRLVDRGFLKSFEDEHVSNRPLTVNNLAAFLSHLEALHRVRDALKSKYTDFGVILEDDVILSQDFQSVVKSVAKSIEDRDDVDVVLLYVFPSQGMIARPISLVPLSTTRVLVPTPEGLWGQQGYLVTRSGVDKLIEGFGEMRSVMDEQMTRIENLNSWVLSGPSIIEEDNVGAPSVTATPAPTLRELYERESDIKST